MPSTTTSHTTFNSLIAGYLPTNPEPDQMPTVSTSSASVPMSAHHSTQNPSTNPSTSSAVPTTQAPDITEMANTINTLVQSNVPSRVKLREPDTFDGSDLKKLQTFLLHCKLNFQDRPDIFPDRITKVNYVLSYLKGSALECFEPGLLDPTMPAWASNFDLFIEELEANFRTYDLVGKAEAELEGLRMQENHQAMKYFIKFMQLATRIQWGQAALLRQAYNGLANESRTTWFIMISPLCFLTSESLFRLSIPVIGSWERKAEISHKNTSSTSRNKSENKSNNSKTEKGKGSSKSKQKDSNSSSGLTLSKGSTSESKKLNPNLSSKLGKDGKLTPQERQCRLNKNLCLFCGASGHMAKDCLKSTSTAAKARAASTTPAPKSTSTLKPSEPKKD